jgi:hypothetical protein
VPAAPAARLPPPPECPNARIGSSYPTVAGMVATRCGLREMRHREGNLRANPHGPQRNGGRHCCQPPLRRAKDPPVFVTWFKQPESPWNPLSILAHQLRRRFPSDRSLLAEEPDHLLDCAARRFAGLSTVWPAQKNRSSLVKAVRRSAALLGMTTSCVPLCSPRFRETPKAASREMKVISSGASSRLAPKRTRKFSPLPAGGDRTFGHLPRPPAVAGSWGGRDRRPDHPCTMRFSSESGKRKMREKACG